MQLSIIIPVFNEAQQLPGLLADLQCWRHAGAKVIVSDGGSVDGTVECAEPLVDRLVASPRGRARQMNVGAEVAGGEALWFLHADSRVNNELRRQLLAALDAGVDWGRFDVRLSDPGIRFRIIAMAMNRRSRLTGIATGDQGLFVRRELFEGLGGFPDQPLMEDIALSARLRRCRRPCCLPGPLVTSSRRWVARGTWRTVGLMWWLRFDYWRGVPPERLHRRYNGRGSA